MYAQGGGSISRPPSALFTLFIPTSVRIGSQLSPVLMHIAFAVKFIAVDGFLHSEIIPIARIVIRAIRACCSAGRFALRQAAAHAVDHRHRRRAGDIIWTGLSVRVMPHSAEGCGVGNHGNKLSTADPSCWKLTFRHQHQQPTYLHSKYNDLTRTEHSNGHRVWCSTIYGLPAKTRRHDVGKRRFLGKPTSS